jgi:hypothetical protein
VSTESLAKVAYEAYVATTDYKNFRGEPVPPYDNLPGSIKRAWEEAASKCREVLE